MEKLIKENDLTNDHLSQLYDKTYIITGRTATDSFYCTSIFLSLSHCRGGKMSHLGAITVRK